jgi:hypothetical protein
MYSIVAGFNDFNGLLRVFHNPRSRPPIFEQRPRADFYRAQKFSAASRFRNFLNYKFLIRRPRRRQRRCA